MIKLYRSSIHGQMWVAQITGLGWVMFPAVENGWEQRRAARGLDPVHLREVPLRWAANTGILEHAVADFAEVA